MGCSSEHWTHENRGVRGLRTQLAIANICIRWPGYLHRERARIRQERFYQALQEQRSFRKQVALTKQKVRTWKNKQLRAKHAELFALRKKHNAEPSSVTPEDWDKTASGSEWKVHRIYSKNFPRNTWPAGVPYLNLIALSIHNAKQRVAKAARKATKKKKKRTPVMPKPETQDIQNQGDPKPTDFVRSLGPKVSPVSLSDPNFLVLSRQNNAIRQAQYDQEDAARDAEVKSLTHYLRQLERVHTLLARSRVNPTVVTVKMWQDATAGTDILQTHEEVRWRVEFARRLEAGEVDKSLHWRDMQRAFEDVRREIMAKSRETDRSRAVDAV